MCQLPPSPLNWELLVDLLVVAKSSVFNLGAQASLCIAEIPAGSTTVVGWLFYTAAYCTLWKNILDLNP